MSSPVSYIAALKKHGSVRKAAKATNILRSTFFDGLNKEREALRSIQNAEKPLLVNVHSSTKPRYYIFTAAVKGAAVHTDFFNNLKSYAKYLGAELVVGPLTSTGRQRYAAVETAEFKEELIPFISNEPIIIGDKIRFSPELNLTPTMVKPLQGLQTYTKKLWGIFPHTKVSLETVATHKHHPAKFIATTGAVTHPHYTPTKAGFRAHFDHVHGALIVEVTKKGVWFRQLSPTDELDGTFYDLGNKVERGKVSWSDGVSAIIYGDIHIEKIDEQVAKATWGLGANKSESFTPLADYVNAETQVFHDLMDMSWANYHEMDDVFSRYASWCSGESSADTGFNLAIEFLKEAEKKAKRNIVVDSNHDYFVKKWLLKFDPAKKEDFGNIEAFYSLKLDLLRAIRFDNPASLLDKVMRSVFQTEPAALKVLDSYRFLRPDESFELHNVECGWHGHAGPNGRRGSKSAFKFVTEKSTIAHLHSPSIESGTHVVGTSTKLDLGYNQGPSSWAHTHGIIYPNGGRTLVTLSDGKFWAVQGDVA